MTETPLDTAHALMIDAPDNDAARLRFYERLADSELFLLLIKEADGDRIEPHIFDTEDGRFVLVFDRDHRLSQFTGDIAPYAALSGRVVTELLAGQGIGLGVNLGVAPSSILIPPEAVEWLHDTLSEAPEELTAHVDELHPPLGLPDTLLTGIDAKLAQASGLASMAYLAAVTYRDARRGHLLAIIDALPGSEPSLARMIDEALVFSGLEAGELDVVFFRASDPMAATLARVGLRFDLPEPDTPTAPSAPGMDPAKPPKLR